MTVRTQKRLIDLAAVIGYAVLALAFFWKIAFTNRVLVGLDVFSYFYPYRAAVSEALTAGRLPLWNPYLFMGAPLLANSQAAVLYPLHWPLMWLSPPKQVAWSIVVHVWLAGVGTYFFARWPLRRRPLAAFLAGIVFAFGGFLGAQVEHINQLNASAWLPWLLLCLEKALTPDRWRWPALLVGGAVVALALLAGHTQAAYIVLFGVAAYAAIRGLGEARGLKRWHRLRALRGLGILGAMALMGVILSAGQILPTLELSRLSVRSGGLGYQEAASFSLKPALLFKAFLPPLVWDVPFTEFVAYVGLLGLALAGLGAWAILRRRGAPRRHGAAELAVLGLALLGIFLAFGAYNPLYYVLYRLIPGFSLFRAPARWLLLYAFGAAILVSLGLEALPRGRRLRAVVVVLALSELFVASRRLAYNQPTAPAAFDSMRAAPAHLLANTSREPFRFLSLSDITYDPGDLGDLTAAYGTVLSEQAIYDLLVATKMKEVLAFNLPLRYRLFSVDGYDGGLLPTARYVTLERLFLGPDQIWSDGRLRQQLKAIPATRLLSLLNIRYVITDKMQDAWVDGVYYDLEHTMQLGQVTLTDLPDLESTHLGVVTYLTGAAALPDGTPVAQVKMTDTEGMVVTHTLRAGLETAEGLYSASPVAHRQARVAHQWRDSGQGNDYVAVIDVGKTVQLARIEVRSLLPQDRGMSVALRGLTLMDGRARTSRTVSIDPNYRLVHSGDVKIYENLAVLPRAFVADRATIRPDDVQALSLLKQPEFDPSHEVILAEGRELAGSGGPASVELLSYEAEDSQWRVALDSPGYLVISDSFYPGWEARVDGQRVPILRADVYLRAIALEPGQHLVALRFKPATVPLGLSVGAIAWLVWVLAAALSTFRAGRNWRVRV